MTAAQYKYDGSSFMIHVLVVGDIDMCRSIEHYRSTATLHRTLQNGNTKHWLRASRTSSHNMESIVDKTMRVLLVTLLVRSETHHVCEKTTVSLARSWSVWVLVTYFKEGFPGNSITCLYRGIFLAMRCVCLCFQHHTRSAQSSDSNPPATPSARRCAYQARVS